MQRRRILAVALAWVYPLFFVAATVFLKRRGWISEDGRIVLMFCLGPVPFAGLLSHLLFNRRDEPLVGYARASRRMGYMCKASAALIAILFFPMVHFSLMRSPGFVGECVVALWLFLFFGMISLMVAAVVFRAMQMDSREPGGAKDAFAVTAVIALLAMVLLPGVAHRRPQEVPRRSSCANNLKQSGLACKWHANDHEGCWPELSSRPGYLSMDAQKNVVIPEYTTYPDFLICPNDVDRKDIEDATASPQELFDNSSYVYLGYMMKDEQELETFFECYKERVAAGLAFDEDLPAPPGRGSGGGDKILRLREGAEMVYVTGETDPAASARAQSEIPVMFDRNAENHIPPGVNVLYMDGGVRFHKYPGDWPITAKTFTIIEAIESMRPQDPQPLPTPHP